MVKGYENPIYFNRKNLLEVLLKEIVGLIMVNGEMNLCSSFYVKAILNLEIKDQLNNAMAFLLSEA